MALLTVRCPVSHVDVVRVTDFEGATQRVICGDYEETTGECRLKAAARGEGPLSRLLDRMAERSLASHGVRCDLA
jgi:hypothetical protein